MTAPGELVSVKLLGVPVDLYRQASEHQDELRREFALMQHGSSSGDADVPRRLLQLVDELDARFGAFAHEPRRALTGALGEGTRSIDVEYRVPPEAKEAAAALAALLEEADGFCRRGDHLLTLATPPGPLAFRRWYLAEFVAQIDGADPTPWDQREPKDGPG